MLELIRIALEADRLAREARNARCCDALRPCHSCVLLRHGVRARRLLLKTSARIRSTTAAAAAAEGPAGAHAGAQAAQAGAPVMLAS